MGHSTSSGAPEKEKSKMTPLNTIIYSVAAIVAAVCFAVSGHPLYVVAALICAAALVMELP
jgi:hypothetical protein